MRLVHLTDTHLAHLSAETAVEQFGRKVREESSPDLVVITGDVAAIGSLDRCLCQFHDGLAAPIAFVLGNHDSHGVTWLEARDHARRVAERYSWLTYLDESASIELSRTTALIGCDGWYDGRCGSREEAHRAGQMAADLFWVSNTRSMIASGKKGILSASKRAREYADSLVAEAQRSIRKALAKYNHVFFATHVPPFEDSAWHLSAPSDNNWLPIMVCKSMGDMLMKEAAWHPAKDITVLCGHTHTARRYSPAYNLTVYTGHSGAKDYGAPGVSNWFDLEDE